MKKLLAVLLVVVMIFGLVACGGDKKDDADDADEAADEPAEEVEEEAEPAEEEAEPAEEAEEDEESGEAEGGLTFGVTYWIETDFFRTIANSIDEEAVKDGNEIIVVDEEQDSTKQIQTIEDFIAKGVDAVFLNPVDRDAIEPALNLLKEAGIPVINFDTSVANMDLIDGYVATDNVQAGVLCAEALLADFPDGADIAVLNYPANSACLDREQGFLDTIEGKDINILETFDAEGVVGNGESITSDILQSHPDIDAIFCINDQSGMGAFAAVTVAGSSAKIYGVDGAPDAKEAISQENSVYAMTAAQSPVKIGKECYAMALEILANGEPTEFQIDVPAFTIDKSNIEEYLNQDWQ